MKLVNTETGLIGSRNARLEFEGRVGDIGKRMLFDHMTAAGFLRKNRNSYGKLRGIAGKLIKRIAVSAVNSVIARKSKTVGSVDVKLALTNQKRVFYGDAKMVRTHSKPRKVLKEEEPADAQ